MADKNKEKPTPVADSPDKLAEAAKKFQSLAKQLTEQLKRQQTATEHEQPKVSAQIAITIHQLQKQQLIITQVNNPQVMKYLYDAPSRNTAILCDGFRLVAQEASARRPAQLKITEDNIQVF